MFFSVFNNIVKYIISIKVINYNQVLSHLFFERNRHQSRPHHYATKLKKLGVTSGWVVSVVSVVGNVVPKVDIVEFS